MNQFASSFRECESQAGRKHRLRPGPSTFSKRAKNVDLRAQYRVHLYPCLGFAGHLAVSAQNSGPSSSLALSRGSVVCPASCRFIPAHGLSFRIAQHGPAPAQPPCSYCCELHVEWSSLRNFLTSLPLAIEGCAPNLVTESAATPDA